MLLSDIDIAKIAPMIISPFSAESIQPASYDLRLDNQILIPFAPSGSLLDGMDLRKDKPSDYMFSAELDDGFVLHSGKCVLGSTIEVVSCPSDIAIRVEGKSSLARLFMLPHVAAGWIDPGFKGQITLEIVNLGPWPIKLYHGMFIAQMNFTTMSTPVATPYGTPSLGSHYYGQTGPTSSTGNRGK